MTLALTLMLLTATPTPVCNPAVPGSAIVIADEIAAVAAAKSAWKSEFSQRTVKEREPYHARLAGGAWHVFGTLPTGLRGGTPEAFICASDGKVVRIFHSQ